MNFSQSNEDFASKKQISKDNGVKLFSSCVKVTFNEIILSIRA